MSTSTAKSLPKAPPLPSQAPRPSAGEEVITAAIRDAQAALWRAELSRALLTVVIAALLALVGWAVVDQWIWSPGPLVRLVALLAALVAIAGWIVTRVLPLLRSRIRADYAAHSIEHDLPELRHALTSYVSLRGDGEAMGPRGAVVRSIGARAAGQMKQRRLEVPSEATGTFSWWIGLAVALAVAAAYALLSPKDTLQSTQRLLLPLASIDAPTRVEIREVTPGDCEVLADRPLEISAEIAGLASHDEPSVQYGQRFAQRQPLQLDASTGRFTATVRVSRSTQYQIAAGDALAGPFNITARDVPVASVRSVQIVPPKYTQLPTRQSTGGAITAEENSQVTVTATINRAIERARLEFNPRKTAERSGPSAGSVDMQVSADGLSATATVPLRLPRDQHAAVAIDSYRVRVWDTDGNENPDPIVYPVRVIPDLAPEISIVAPREVAKEVPINSQQLFEIAALDPDYGLRRIELTWQRGVDLPVTEILWSAADAVRGNQVTDYRFRPEPLGLRVGDKLLVSAIAIDNREDLAGQPAPNRSQTQPIELLIVAAQQLPPVNAPEDGLSEPDDEPASGGNSQPNDQGGGQGEQGDGQAGGGSAGGDDAAAGQDAQQSGQAGDGGGQGDDQGAPAENQQSGNGQNADQPATASPDANGTAQGESAGGDTGDGSSGDGRDQNAMPQSDSATDPGASGSQGEQGSGGASEPQGSDGAQPGEADPAVGGERASDGSSAGGEQAAGESQPSDGAGSDAAAGDERPGTAGDGTSGQTPGDADSSAADPATPPQHDGDAFERIRDYLNQKQQAGQRSTSPDDEPTAAGQAPQEQRSPQAQESAANQTPADADETNPGGPAGSEAAEPTAGDAASDPAASNEAAPADSGGNTESDNRPPAAGDQAAEGDGAPAADSDSSQSGDQPPATDGASGENGDATGENGDATGENAAAEQSNPPTDGAEPARHGEGGAAESAAGSEAAADAQPQPAADAGSPPPSGGDQTGTAPGQTSGDGGPASDLGTGGQEAGHDARPPDPVDLEHARQATDLVLDYLDQNRDTPDPELLERLNWTPEELRDFTNRWRELLKGQDDTGAGSDAQQVEEALRSLGLRKPAKGPIGDTRGRDDALRGLRDGGNRPPAPTLYRDAFDAFRRGLGRP